MNEQLKRKLKRECVEACLNCDKFVDCDNIGKFEECVDFEEVEGEAWVIKRLLKIQIRSALMFLEILFFRFSNISSII